MMLKKVFDMDNPIMQALATAFDLMLLNILAMIATLPVITAGASLVALFDASQKIVRDEDIYVSRYFFTSFKKNFMSGVKIGIIILIAAVLIAFNYMAAREYIPVLRYFSLAMGILLLALAIYTFTLAARFDNSIKDTFLNALRLMIGYFPRTLIMLVLTMGFYILSVNFPQVGMPVLMLFGLSLPAYICSLISRPIIDSLHDGKEGQA